MKFIGKQRTIQGFTKGRTIRYLRGGWAITQKKFAHRNNPEKKYRAQHSTNLSKKKIEQGLGVIFKNVVQLF